MFHSTGWVPTIDMGPIAYAERFPIDDTDSGLSLSLKCIRAGMPLVEKLLHTAACGFEAIPRVPRILPIDGIQRRPSRRRSALMGKAGPSSFRSRPGR